MNRTKLMLEAALHYRNAYGFSIIPSSSKKRPILKTWKKYQKQLPTEEEIKQWWGEDYPGANISLVCGKLSNRIVVDVDIYKKHGKAALEEVENITPENLTMPIVETPRGGEHRYFLAHPEVKSSSHAVSPDREPNKYECIDIKSEGGLALLPPSKFNGKEYAWFDGLAPKDTKAPFIPQSYVDFINKRINRGGVVGGGISPKVKQQGDKKLHKLQLTTKIQKGYRDNTLFHIANHLAKGQMPVEEIQQYLRLINKHCVEDPLPDADITTKISSALHRQRNVSQEIREWIETTTGYFQTTECHRELQLTTKEEALAANAALQRLCKQGLLERYGDRRGCYRMIDKECEKIDWIDVDDSPLDIRFPFGMEQFVNLLQKTVTVIAGEQDAGKTAYLLNMAWLNCKRHKSIYFSSEMDAAELKGRLKLFNDIDLSDFNKRIEFYDRSRNFIDVIVPDAINYIDYFEIADNFYRIGKYLADIRDKLTTGLAIVALQKDKDKAVGRGGSFGLEKPRLYLNIEQNFPGQKIEIIKGKIWTNPEMNPNGLVMEYKTVKGINLVPQGMWDLP